MINGVIFDFNGTLFWDTELHNQTWDRYLTRYDILLTDEEKHLHLHGKNNRQIVRDLFGSKVSEDEIMRISAEKELMYQDLVRRVKLQLAEGVVDLLEFLIKRQIPISIVTASDKLNVDLLNIYVSYWFHPPEWWDFMKHSHWINRQIMERFNAAGIDFAFPTQTLHLAGDEKRQLDIGLRDDSSRNAK